MIGDSVVHHYDHERRHESFECRACGTDWDWGEPVYHAAECSAIQPALKYTAAEIAADKAWEINR